MSDAPRNSESAAVSKAQSQAGVDANSSSYVELGLTGLKRYSGLVRDEYDKRIAGTRWCRTAREMADNEPTIGATLYVIEMMLRQTRWRVEPANETPQAKEIAEHVESCFNDLLEDNGWHGLHSDMLSCLVYGWASLEKVYKKRCGLLAPIPSLRSKFNDGLVGWRKFGIRSQDTVDTWNFDQHGKVLGFTQKPPPDFIARYIPREKYLHFTLRNRAGSPEGYSLLRPIYATYYFLKNIKVIEAIGIERHLAGLPVINVPTSVYNATDRTNINSYLRMVRSIKNDEYAGIVLPAEEENGEKTGYKFGLLASGGRSPTDVDTIVKRYESRIAIALMTQFLLLGQDKVGSYSLADRNTDLFALGLATILDMRDEQFNNDAIPELVNLNGWPVELSPRLCHGDIEVPNLTELATYISTLVSSGVVTPDAKLETHLRDLANLPETDSATATAAPADSVPQPTAADVYGPPAAAAAAAPEGDTSVAQQSLNGAQIASLVDVLNSVTQGQIPRASAVEIIVTAFPVTRAQAEAMLGEIGRGFVPATPPVAP